MDHGRNVVIVDSVNGMDIKGRWLKTSKKKWGTFLTDFQQTNYLEQQNLVFMLFQVMELLVFSCASCTRKIDSPGLWQSRNAQFNEHATWYFCSLAAGKANSSDHPFHNFTTLALIISCLHWCKMWQTVSFWTDNCSGQHNLKRISSN